MKITEKIFDVCYYTLMTFLSIAFIYFWYQFIISY